MPVPTDQELWYATRINCSTLSKHQDFPGCCDSCHDDQSMGYNMPAIRVGGVYIDSCCCNVARWIDENPLLIEWALRQNAPIE